MRENFTYGSMRGSRRKTAKSVLRVAEGRAGVPDNKGRPALLYTLLGPNDPRRRNRQAVLGSRFKVKFVRPSSKG